MRKFIFLALPLLFVSIAQARPSTWTMSCASAANMVKNSRGIVMNYGYSSKAGYLYRMFYPDSYLCRREGNYDAEYAYVKTTDSNHCWIGYYCIPSQNWP
jgi:hypothetical protein